MQHCAMYVSIINKQFQIYLEITFCEVAGEIFTKTCMFHYARCLVPVVGHVSWYSNTDGIVCDNTMVLPIDMKLSEM